MTLKPQKLFLFGDEFVDRHHAMKVAIEYSRNSPAVLAFLEQSFDAIKSDASQIFPERLAKSRTFADILYLAKKNETANHFDEIITGVFVGVSRLAELIL
jgi:Starter unit:ACP transacylase in aflatoxin biosynthesis